jgi:hypothetical protein
MVLLGDVANVPLAQKSFWTHPMVFLGDKAQVEAHFGPFRDGANLDATSVHGLCQTYHRLINRFYTPNGTPR